jgi:hypothetical protein
MTMQYMKRKFATALALLPISAALTACKAQAMGERPNEMSNKRFKGIGLILVVDAVPGAEMLGVEFYADGDLRPFYASSLVAKRNREIMSYPGGKVPTHIRVVWRKTGAGHPVRWGSGEGSDDFGKSKPNYLPPDRGVIPFDPLAEIERRKTIMANLGKTQHGPWASTYGDEVLGDYTIAVASRIPDMVLQDIRARGGGLRLKFRLKPDGVLFGWDIERPGGGISRFDLPGGDFLDTRY